MIEARETTESHRGGTHFDADCSKGKVASVEAEAGGSNQRENDLRRALQFRNCFSTTVSTSHR